MNKSEFTSLLNQNISDLEFNNVLELKDIQWRVQDCTESDVLFFKCSGHPNLEILKQVQDKKIGLVLVDNKDVYQDLVGNKGLVSTENWLEAQKNCLDFFYPLKDGLRTVGITGTNGKSTALNFLEQILLLNKKEVVSCGTLGLFINGVKEKDFALTTPSFIDIRKILNQHSERENFLFEVSSHSLAQERFYKIPFSQVGWTSFSQDHLDYHKTMESYFKEKLKIKNYCKEKIVVPQREKSLISMFEDNTIQISKILENYPKEGVFSADFNKSNFELALSLAQNLFGPEMEYDLAKIEPVPGRFQLIPWGEHYFVIDFAHTPDALENICRELKKNYPDRDLITVFGCGGDRDQTKRPLMAKAAEKNSDQVILTSDNPRFEDPFQIIEQARTGFVSPDKHIVEADRVSAIGQSLGLIKRPSIILVAGKGHENYLDIKGVKHDYSDERTILSLIEKMNASV